MRKTGIEIIGDAAWGTHLCQFYQTKEDLIDILVPYFRAGMENNEFCMWITSEPLTVKEAIKAMRRTVSDFDLYLEKGQIEILSHTEWYLKDGSFNLQRVLNAWIEKLKYALARGYDGIRVSGNTAWLEQRYWKDFSDYEREINNAIGKYRMLAICTYSLDKCGTYEIIDVVRNHQFAIIKREGKWIAIESYENRQTQEELRKYRERLEELVRERTAELETINKELEAFSYSVSHDLRAPLRSMNGFSHILLEDYAEKLDEEGKEHLKRISAASRRMAQLIDDLLNLSRITQSEMYREKVNLSSMAERIARELREKQPERKAEFVIAPELAVDGDMRFLRIVLEHLLDNAWKFTGKNARARIEFGVVKYDGRPAYFVRDNGVGFDMAYAGKLFNPFERLHSESEFPGTGIGLAIVQRIIHRHGGSVWAESEAEKGATFYFTL
jgi:signal transduction histidine kinase